MHLVAGGQLRTRVLQLALKRGWFFQNDSVLVRRFRPGVGRSGVSPACVRLLVRGEVFLSINHREVLAVERGLSQFRRFLRGLVVETFLC